MLEIQYKDTLVPETCAFQVIYQMDVISRLLKISFVSIIGNNQPLF
jgi:hypothetical protein